MRSLQQSCDRTPAHWILINEDNPDEVIAHVRLVREVTEHGHKFVQMLIESLLVRE